MTKKLDPEIKALRAVDRAVLPLPPDARDRLSTWLNARTEADHRRPIQRISLSFDEAVAVVSAAFNEDHDPDALEGAIKRLGDWIDARLEAKQPPDPANQEAM